jgi:hypothetical protein
MANNLKRPFINYMTDVGFTYLVIPIILSIFSYKNKLQGAKQ